MAKVEKVKQVQADETVETASKNAADKENETPQTTSSQEAFVVCQGKALTSARGILSDGASISAKDLAGGDEAFKAFIKGGYIEKAAK